MSNSARVLSCMSLIMLSCGPREAVQNESHDDVSVYHNSSAQHTPALMLLATVTLRLIPGLYKPMTWLATLRRDAVRISSNAPSFVRIAVLSDMNGSYGSTQYREPVHAAVEALIDSFEPSLVISTGDMVAGMKAGLDYEAMWQAFHEVVTLPLDRAGIPFLPTPGNHDGTNRPGFELERDTYEDTWRAHRPNVKFVDSDFYPRHYAVLYEGVLLISVDASTVGKISKAQRAWLEDVLEAHADVPAKIVYGHVPLYPLAIGREREVLDDAGLEAMFVKYGVSVYLSGHHHAYYPGRRDNGLRLVSMACLGGGPRRLMESVSADVSPRALAILEIDARTGQFEVEAYTASDFGARIERESLPEAIGAGDKRVVRDDL